MRWLTRICFAVLLSIVVNKKLTKVTLMMDKVISFLLRVRDHRLNWITHHAAATLSSSVGNQDYFILVRNCQQCSSAEPYMGLLDGSHSLAITLTEITMVWRTYSHYIALILKWIALARVVVVKFYKLMLACRVSALVKVFCRRLFIPVHVLFRMHTANGS